MCGIAGILSLRGEDVAPSPVQRMTDALVHRGPDGEGISELGPCVLGHRRLAIIDLSQAGAQPMQLEDAGLTISYNGEVYNYVELREELRAAGDRFRSESDTEVVLRAYARWGEEAFQRFNGMWALAIWDARRRRCVLSRDRFGIKPLYLLEQDGRLLFASEQKALLAAAPEARAIDAGVLGRFLQHGIQDDGPRTFFAGIRQLMPGQVLSISLGPPVERRQRSFWCLPGGAGRALDGETSPDELRELLEDAVRLRLRSDVPVGTCLSGGLDSSSVVALASRHTREPVRTFTAIHADPGYDEGHYAREVVRRFGCQAHEVEPDPGRELVPLLDRIGWFHDEPCARPGLITQWHVMSLAAGQVTVLLDGQGGDEVLLGYAAYAVPYLRSLLHEAARRPALLPKLWRDGWGLLAQPSTSPEGPGPLALHLARAGLRRLRRRSEPDWLAPDLLEAAGRVTRERSPSAPGVSRIDRLMRDELRHLSIPALLHHEDRTSMAFSLEARVPFLDHRVVELALGMDFGAKVEGGQMKAILRRAMSGILPESIVSRRDKLGYPTPVGRWLREAAADVEPCLRSFEARGLTTPGVVWSTWQRHLAGRGDPWRLYRCLTTELWLRRFVDHVPIAPSGVPSRVPLGSA